MRTEMKSAIAEAARVDGSESEPGTGTGTGVGSGANANAPSRNGRKSKASAEIAAAANGPRSQRYLLRLYVAGVTAASALAISNLKLICEEHLHGRYELDVVDIYQQPALAMSAQIIAVPTLIRKLPRPLRRVVGDMSQKERVLVGLDLLART